FIEQVTPTRFVVRDARVKEEVVTSTGNRDRVELDRAELAEDLEHTGETSLDRSRRGERVPGNEKTARGLGGDVHVADASDPDGRRDVAAPRASRRAPAVVPTRRTPRTPRSDRPGPLHRRGRSDRRAEVPPYPPARS